MRQERGNTRWLLWQGGVCARILELCSLHPTRCVRRLDGRRNTERPNPEVISLFRRPGGYGGVAAPDPIPNSAVKRSSANGTAS
jgi:hypothetical protein